MIRTPETIARMDEYAILQKARIDKAIEDWQDLLDNPERHYWQLGTRLHPEKIQFTHLLYKPFPCCKPDLDMALNAITSDCGTDIRQMIEGYGGGRQGLDKYEISVRARKSERQWEKKQLRHTFPLNRHGFTPHKTTDGGDGAAYEEPLRELYERIKQANATYIRERVRMGSCRHSWGFNQRSEIRPIGWPLLPRTSKISQSKESHNQYSEHGWSVLRICAFVVPWLTSRLKTVIVQISTLMKCSNGIILPIFHTPLNLRTSISMKIYYKLIFIFIRFPMTRAKVGTRSSPVENDTPEEQICFTGMSITLQSPTLPVFYLIYRSMSIAKIYADDVLEVFTTKSLLPNMSVFAPARTLCRCCTCFWLLTLNRPTLIQTIPQHVRGSVCSICGLWLDSRANRTPRQNHSLRPASQNYSGVRDLGLDY